MFFFPWDTRFLDTNFIDCPIQTCMYPAPRLGMFQGCGVRAKQHGTTLIQNPLESRKKRRESIWRSSSFAWSFSQGSVSGIGFQTEQLVFGLPTDMHVDVLVIDFAYMCTANKVTYPGMGKQQGVLRRTNSHGELNSTWISWNSTVLGDPPGAAPLQEEVGEPMGLSS